MIYPKQIIAVRKDLGMNRGKIASQVAHASMAVLLDAMTTEDDGGTERECHYVLSTADNDALEQWLSGAFTKICVWVNSEEELLNLHRDAKSVGIMTSIIKDNGTTTFNGVPTYTTCAIGPAFSDELHPITGHLKLMS